MSDAVASPIDDSSQMSKSVDLPTPNVPAATAPADDVAPIEEAPAEHETSKCTARIGIAVVLIAGLVIHAYDCISDVMYIVNTDFYSQSLYAAAIVFVVLSPLLQIALTVSGLCSIYRVYKRSNTLGLERQHLSLKAAGAILMSALGLFDMIFLYVVFTHKSNEILSTFHVLSKTFALISAVFESIPQFIITMLNNYYTNTWSLWGICSLTGSVLAAIYDSLSCVQSIDHIIKLYPEEVEEEMYPSTPNSSLPRKAARLSLEISSDKPS
jgi:hypothetical protein